MPSRPDITSRPAHGPPDEHGCRRLPAAPAPRSPVAAGRCQCACVKEAVRAIRHQLGLPPPQTSQAADPARSPGRRVRLGMAKPSARGMPSAWMNGRARTRPRPPAAAPAVSRQSAWQASACWPRRWRSRCMRRAGCTRRITPSACSGTPGSPRSRSLLATVALGLAALQVLLALWIYCRLPLAGTRRGRCGLGTGSSASACSGSPLRAGRGALPDRVRCCLSTAGGCPDGRCRPPGACSPSSSACSGTPPPSGTTTAAGSPGPSFAAGLARGRQGRPTRRPRRRPSGRRGRSRRPRCGWSPGAWPGCA